MLKIRYVLIVLGMLFYSVTSSAQVSVSIGINVPVYPQLVVVPGYPVYYAPRLQANFFFYDGLYWVYQDDDWYSSSWYNGPWWLVYPEDVPVFILRIPVRYYLLPPRYFFGWRHDAPPRWGDHWGHDWSQRRSGWDRWDRRSAPPPAPPPVYQRQYSGDRYPRQVEQQQELNHKKYRYQPRDPVVRQRYQEQVAPSVPAEQKGQRVPKERDSEQQDIKRSTPSQQGAPRSESPQRRGEDVQRSISATPQQGGIEVQDHRQQPQLGSDRREQQIQRAPTQHEERRASEERGFRQQDDSAATSQPSQELSRRELQKHQLHERKAKQQSNDTATESKREQTQERGRGRHE